MSLQTASNSNRSKFVSQSSTRACTIKNNFFVPKQGPLSFLIPGWFLFLLISIIIFFQISYDLFLIGLSDLILKVVCLISEVINFYERAL